MRIRGQVVRGVVMVVPTSVVLMAALSLAPGRAHGQFLPSDDVQLTWVDRTGNPVETVGTPAGYNGLDLSPDGRRVAIHRNDGDGGDIWIFETDRDTVSRLTVNADGDLNNSMPIWSPDGSRVVFGAVRNGRFGLYVKRADGVGDEERLIETDVPAMPMSWSPDGRFIVYHRQNRQWVLPMAGDRTPFQLLDASSSHGQISPDGNWIAYTSGGEVYVTSFPTGSDTWQVSTNGGSFARWRADGRELYFMSAGSWGQIMVADMVVTGSSIEPGTPRALFDSGYNNNAGGRSLGYWHTYAVSPDGQHFLIPRPDPPPGLVKSTVAYRQVDGHEILADVYRPADDDVRPVIVWLHGGALINGNREGIQRQVGAVAEEKGYALVSFDYRLAPETKLPELIGDIEAAFRWLAGDGAEQFHLDADRIVVAGGSAGGYLTLVTGYRVQPQPKALVALYGYGDLIGEWYSEPSPHPRHNRRAITLEEALQQTDGTVISDARRRGGNGGAIYNYYRQTGTWPEAVSGFDDLATIAEKIAVFEPVRHVTASYPPTLLIHGTNDTDVPYEQSTMMAEQFRQHGVPFLLKPIDNGEHGFGGGDPQQIEDAYKTMRDFIIEHLDAVGRSPNTSR